MQAILTDDQIITILAGYEQGLRLLQSTESYRKLESSDRFHTSNDLVLGDAIQALFEIQSAIAELAN